MEGPYIQHESVFLWLPPIGQSQILGAIRVRMALFLYMEAYIWEHCIMELRVNLMSYHSISRACKFSSSHLFYLPSLIRHNFKSSTNILPMSLSDTVHWAEPCCKNQLRQSGTWTIPYFLSFPDSSKYPILLTTWIKLPHCCNTCPHYSTWFNLQLLLTLENCCHPFDNSY